MKTLLMDGAFSYKNKLSFFAKWCYLGSFSVRKEKVKKNISVQERVQTMTGVSVDENVSWVEYLETQNKNSAGGGREPLDGIDLKEINKLDGLHALKSLPNPLPYYAVALKETTPLSGENELFINQVNSSVEILTDGEKIQGVRWENLAVIAPTSIDEGSNGLVQLKSLHHLPPLRQEKKPGYVVVKMTPEELEEETEMFFRKNKKSSLAYLPPVERVDGVFKEKIMRGKNYEMPVTFKAQTTGLRVRAESFVHNWIPGVSTPEGIVLASGLAVLSDSSMGVDSLERFSTIASTLIVAATTLGIPSSALTFLQ